MKSLTLSLLVAFGLTFGAANAFADPPAPVSVSPAAQEAVQQAMIHERLAAQYRITARFETQKAKDSMAIAVSDDEHGFPYEAGVQRAKAFQHQLAAREAFTAAAREDAIAARYRATAAQYSAPPALSIKIIRPR